jgi:hypothetical protein
MSTKHGCAALACRMDMQLEHGSWTNCKDYQYGHEVWTCSMDMQHEHAAWTYSIDMQIGQAALTSNMDEQHGDMDMQYVYLRKIYFVVAEVLKKVFFYIICFSYQETPSSLHRLARPVG